MKTDWQNLLWNWTTATEPYGLGHWNVIIEGLVESLSEVMNVRFVRSCRIWYDIQRPAPGIGFSVHHISEDPMSVSLEGRCSIDTYIEEDGTKLSGASMVLFHYQNRKRLVRDGKSYEFWQFLKTENGTGSWTNHGWFFDEFGEWEGYTWDDLIR